MSNQISTQTISFNNQALITFEQNGTRYTAMKPICENIGLAWEPQLLRIKRDDILSSTMIITIIVAEDGKNREMVCLPIEYLNGWLFGIDVKRCKPEIRETLIKYKKECYQALHDYWFNGKAERKTTTDERTGLRQAVSALVSKKGLLYSDAYSLIHQRFNVEHIDELTPEQVGMAVEYVHKIYLEGELIIDEPKQNIATPNDETVRIAKYLVRARAFAKEVEVFHRKLYEDLGISRYVKNDIAGKAYDIAHEFNVWLDPFIEQALPQLNQQRLARF
ncbi:phage antirepressor N-terminal domain-containing protein [Glaesserella parasuis]|uniref:phage antirepressor N-terminal domain-containing protein n=1 Tax=Glaesserella parasuis TaxID=738 RepID=UPI00047BD16C|nr:phage antirepressor N-terminal domain-containing protein [Glaesserella parasuis]MDP0329261.1 phage antirepressor N-terminal domain-containing protein [Glaesserella parasuis]MDP0343713.1 phage antirepressor N-terminal domain-containing protein [Glaesserella parasuis]MDP0383403.1 phage antirepressor N-terminal domain-containing protein [Glaesserella parasuis]MDP0391692.1 phage antirepressor N-terminal domain-containing protein [Glaesserella parasuis]